MKKHSTFKRILSIILSLTMVFSIMTISAPHAHAAEVEYYTDSTGKKVAISGITLDGINYYDIFGGKSVLDNYSEDAFFQQLLLAKNKNGNSLLENWATVATAVFKGAGPFFGYSNTFAAETKNFDYWFATKPESFETSGQIVLEDMFADQLGGTSFAYDDNDDNNIDGNVYFSGLSYFSSLSAVQDKMATEILKATAQDGEVMHWGEKAEKEIDDVLKLCADDTMATGDVGDEDPGFKMLNNTDKQMVYGSVITHHNYNNAVSSFGLAFYDFELTPLVNEEIKMLTAADGYESIEDAAQSGAAGVTYTTTGSGNSNVYYLKNASATESTLSANYSEESSVTVSNWMESSKTFSFSESIGTETNISAIFPGGTISATHNLNFTAEQAISTAYGSEKSQTTSNSVSNTVDVTLPPHTQLATTIENGETEIKLDYNCPIYVTYKVAVFSMHSSASSNNGSGGMCTVFGAGNTIGGTNAVESLYFRADKKLNVNGFEEAQGNYFASHNGKEDPPTDYGLAWGSIMTEQKMKDTVEDLRVNIPLSSSGATLSVSSSSMNNKVDGIVPLYPMAYTEVDGNSVFTIAPGGSVDFSKINTLAYNEYHVPYYGYDGGAGTWELCDADGNTLTDVEGVSFNSVGNYRIFTAQKTGTYYAKFLFDETLYGGETNSQLEYIATVTINVTETGLDHNCSAGPWQTSLAATCKANGEQAAYCVVCARLMHTQTVEKREHTPVTSTVSATCQSEGSVTTTCGECRALISSEISPKLEHIPGEWVTTTAPTCVFDGEKQQCCVTCKTILDVEKISAHGHVSGKWEITKASTCTQPGLIQLSCALCSALIGDPVIIAPHEHQLGSWQTVLEPGCETEGEKIRACTVCKGTIETETIPALGHTEGVWTTSLEATCETKGEQHKSCTRCGVTIESQRLDALEHVPGPAMTCVTDQVCLVCEEVLVPADGRSHTWTDWATYEPASFFIEEQQRRECSSCYIEEYRFVKGTSGCHKYFPHCDGSGENCWACETLSNTNGFFRNLGKFLTWFLFENIITNILFPNSHDHFHEYVNTDEMFGS